MNINGVFGLYGFTGLFVTIFGAVAQILLIKELWQRDLWWLVPIWVVCAFIYSFTKSIIEGGPEKRMKWLLIKNQKLFYFWRFLADRIWMPKFLRNWVQHRRTKYLTRLATIALYEMKKQVDQVFGLRDLAEKYGGTVIGDEQ